MQNPAHLFQTIRNRCVFVVSACLPGNTDTLAETGLAISPGPGGVSCGAPALISGFFDNLSHEAIMLQLADEVADGNILRLVEKFLRAGVMEGGRFQRTRVGRHQCVMMNGDLDHDALQEIASVGRRKFNVVGFGADDVELERAAKPPHWYANLTD